MRMHSGRRPFPCTENGCDAAFVKANDLKRHLRVHDELGSKETRTTATPITTTEPTKPAQPEIPMQTDSIVQSPYTCGICNTSFPNFGHLLMHKGKEHTLLSTIRRYSVAIYATTWA